MTFEPDTKYMREIRAKYIRRQLFCLPDFIDTMLLIAVFTLGVVLLCAVDYMP